MKLSWCVGSRNKSQTINQTSRQRNSLKFSEVNVVFVVVIKVKFLLSKWQEKKILLKKSEKKHCLSMSNLAWSGLKKECSFLKLNDKCPNPKCNCQKIITLPHINICLKAMVLKIQ